MLRALILASFTLISGNSAVFAQEVGGAFVPGRFQSPVLVIDFDRLYDQSAYGQRIKRSIENEGAEISAQNREIEAELTEQERALTQMRADLTPADFQKMAEDFDARVQLLRSEQDTKARALGQRSEEARRIFLSHVRHVIAALMQASEAVVILDMRTVFVSLDTADVTNEAIAMLDQRIGDGTALEQAGPTPDTVFDMNSGQN